MTKIKIKTDKNNKEIIMGIWVIVCILAKYIQAAFLPEKYFYDGVRIFAEVSTGYRSGDKGYDSASNFFYFLTQIFHVNSYEAWSVFLGIVGSVIIISFVKESLKDLYFWDFVFITCSLFLVNIYTLNVSKEIIQILLLVPAVWVLKSKWATKTKVLIAIVSLLSIAFFLRTYFLITAVIFYVIYRTFLGSWDQGKKKFWRNVCLILFIGILGLFFLKSQRPDLYEILSDVRNSINENRMNSQDAQTMIVDLFDDNGNAAIYILNMIINIFRLLFPISLIRQGIFQILFLIYQIILGLKLLNLFYYRLNDVKDINIFISASLVISYFIVAAIFEPDYGSVIRHEISMFPIIYITLIRRENYDGKK